MTTITLTSGQAATLVASLEAMLKVLKPKASTKQSTAVVPFRASRSNVTAVQNRVLARNANIARYFSRKGIRLTFDQHTGRFNDVLSYNGWLAAGRQVKRGQRSCQGFFHRSQTEAAAS